MTDQSDVIGNQPIPTVTHLSDVYNPNVFESQKKRYEHIIETYRARHGGKTPDFLVRSPGRVNLIGEHVDYSYFAAVPMALQVDMVMAIGKRTDNKVLISNISVEEYSPREVVVPDDGSQMALDPSTPHWSNYFICGHQVAHGYLSKRYPKDKLKLVGMNVVCDGTVPVGSGLSSSAAFVTTAALSTVKVNSPKDVPEITKHDLVAIAMLGERAVGVNSGGLDQAASVFGERDSALYVRFKPSLRVTPFHFPESDTPFVFLVANSLVVANKRVTGPFNYNLRVVEVAMAAEALGVKYGLQIVQDSDIGTGTLWGFMNSYLVKHEESNYKPGEDISLQVKHLEKMVELTKKALGAKPDGYTEQEAADLVNMTVDQLQNKFMSAAPVRFEKLQLFKRALHVYSEEIRVCEFLLALKGSDKNQLLPHLGDIMNRSQESCRDNYMCSCPEIEQICKIARKSGSFGSRLTGAGFGGSTVHLVATKDVETVKAALIDGYYKVKFPDITQVKLNEALVTSHPENGTMIYNGSVEAFD